MLRFAGFLFVAMLSWFAPAFGQETGDLDALRAAMLTAVNGDRRAAGLAALQDDPALNRAAQNHALDMARRSFYAHKTPEGKTVRDRYLAVGGDAWKIVGENIARCKGCPDVPDLPAIERLQTGWMNSPPHRKNLLNPGFSSFGFGIAMADGVEYAVQNFAGPGADQGTVLTLEEFRLAVLEQVNGLRDEAGRAPVEMSDDLSQAAQTAGEQPDINAILAELNGQGEATWTVMSLARSRCGGCGRNPTSDDASRLIAAMDKGTLTDAELTHAGIGFEADSSGRKQLTVLLGRR